MKQRRFEVYVGSRHVNTVYFDATMTAREVRRSLIDHDGLTNAISVYKRDARNVAFEGCSRASKPNER